MADHMVFRRGPTRVAAAILRFASGTLTHVRGEAVYTPASLSETFRIISSFPATIASDDTCLQVAVTGTLALPTATAGRVLRLKALAALTLTHASVENYDASLGTSTSLVAGESITLRGDGTNWRRWAS